MSIGNEFAHNRSLTCWGRRPREAKRVGSDQAAGIEHRNIRLHYDLAVRYRPCLEIDNLGLLRREDDETELGCRRGTDAARRRLAKLHRSPAVRSDQVRS